MKGILKKTWDNNWFIEYWSTENSHSEVKFIKVCQDDATYCLSPDAGKNTHFEIRTTEEGECAVLSPFVSDDFQIGPDGAYEHEEVIKEYILCAAVWYKDIPIKKEIPNSVRPVNCDRGLVFCGFRHGHCIYTMVSVTGIRSVETEIGEYIQGFLTSKNRFVDREEGAAIHTANGHKIDFENRLFSEDLY